LAKDPSFATEKDDRGWTILHQEALAGSTATVKVLLAAGADSNATTDHGMTPLQLAESLGWEKVAALLAPKS
jgi:ankyrin repeat protein